MIEACSTHGESEMLRIQHFGSKPDGKKQLGRPRRRWKDTIEMDVEERVAWIHLDHNSLKTVGGLFET
jgi:hypothetical protein